MTQIEYKYSQLRLPRLVVLLVTVISNYAAHYCFVKLYMSRLTSPHTIIKNHRRVREGLTARLYAVTFRTSLPPAKEVGEASAPKSAQMAVQVITCIWSNHNSLFPTYNEPQLTAIQSALTRSQSE